MKNRECPYCHKKVSLRKCIKYIIKGTKYSTTCNHCGQQLWVGKGTATFYVLCFCRFFYNVLAYAIFSLLL